MLCLKSTAFAAPVINKLESPTVTNKVNFQFSSYKVPGVADKQEVLGFNSIGKAFTKLFPAYTVAEYPVCKKSASSNLPSRATTGQLYLYSRDSLPSTLVISLLPDPAPNAFALSEDQSANEVATISITSGLLQLLKHATELSFVLAHEFSHLRNDHRYEDPLFFSLLSNKQLKHVEKLHQQWEFTADRDAISAMIVAGIDTKRSFALLSKLSDYERRNGQDVVANHPSIETRIQALAETLNLSSFQGTEINSEQNMQAQLR